MTSASDGYRNSPENKKQMYKNSKKFQILLVINKLDNLGRKQQYMQAS